MAKWTFSEIVFLQEKCQANSIITFHFIYSVCAKNSSGIYWVLWVIYIKQYIIFCRGCDHCEEWYHGDCINVSQDDASIIKKFYCKVRLASIESF